MDVTRKTTLGIRLQRYSFTVLFLAAIGLLAWLSTQYVRQADWTAGGRNSLSEDSARLLDTLTEPVVITSYARENEVLRNQVRELVARYQRHTAEVELHFVNPDAEPERMRELGITMDGELRVVYQGAANACRNSPSRRSPMRCCARRGRANAGSVSCPVTANAIPTDRPITIWATSARSWNARASRRAR
jgi:hypothetical protein